MQELNPRSIDLNYAETNWDTAYKLSLLDPPTVPVDDNKKYFSTPIQEFQYYDKTAKWIESEKRRETWPETVNRALRFLLSNDSVKDKLTLEEFDLIQSSMLNMDAMCSMRVLQMAGPALYRCNMGVYNCAYLALDSLSSFPEMLYILMQGTGVGFSCECKYVQQIPRFKHFRWEEHPPIFAVEDSTEGWCNAFMSGLQAWSTGGDLKFDYSNIRPKGARLKTKGGYAAGPEPLRDLLDFTRKKFINASWKQDGYLTTLDAHDIACKCGEIVQVGGVRRAALLSLSDLLDADLRGAKEGEFFVMHPYRSQANNSTAYNEPPSHKEFLTEWMHLSNSGSGERGIFNRHGLKNQIPTRREWQEFGVNPCGEIILRNRQTCNLSIAIARPNDTEESLMRKVEVATIIGTIQSTFTDFKYVSSKWKENGEAERLLGVDITGQFDCPLLHPENPDRGRLLNELRKHAVKVNKEYAARFGIKQSAAVTCVKPSGNSAHLFGCSSGIHPRYAKYYIRRFRVGAYTPMAQFLKDSGVKFYPEVGQELETATVLVFEFPVKSPVGAKVRGDYSAIEQLENWKEWKQGYTEHNPSFTCQVKDHEWMDVGEWVYNNWDFIGGISFLPYDNGIYKLAPYEEISEGQFHAMYSTFPRLDFDRLSMYEKEDTSEHNLDFACTGAQGCDL